MAETIFWILAILVMTLLLINNIFNLVDTIKTQRELKKLSEERKKLLEKITKKLTNEREEN